MSRQLHHASCADHHSSLEPVSKVQSVCKSRLCGTHVDYPMILVSRYAVGLSMFNRQCSDRHVRYIHGPRGSRLRREREFVSRPGVSHLRHQMQSLAEVDIVSGPT